MNGRNGRIKHQRTGRAVDGIHVPTGPAPRKWMQGKPPMPGRYWVRLASRARGLITVSARDIKTWPRGAEWSVHLSPKGFEKS